MGLCKRRQIVAAPAPHHAHAIELHGVQCRYGRGRTAVHALRGIDLALRHGSFAAVMGPSGCGKSTFLQCAAGLDRPTAGTVKLGGTDITGMSENTLTALRRARLGFVFQSFNLLPSLTVEQNVLLPMRLAGARPDRHRAHEVLAQVGLGDQTRRRPGELSGGQQQGAPPAAASYADRVLFLADGAIADRLLRSPAHEIAERMGRLTTHTPALASTVEGAW
ncbi:MULTISPECIES: ABC transporter ATP-binding protein [Streptomyces violaceusniger group]|uniref:ABC transporter ATP-binding protein n=1 Tax=Streptomyces rhizosphaericus TaxID=114699 RepID=A0ABP4CKI5_9ACTN|nr:MULTISPECIES: ATP-binding cassette domain-containing protein [Streptomyces violaceusniger group]